MSCVVCALYKFVRLENFEALRDPLLDCMLEVDVRGTLLLAHEGINGTIAGTRAGIDKVLAHLRAVPELNDLSVKESYDQSIPFYRTKVKLKKEIVTMGQEGIDPRRVVGTYVKPSDWNALISQEDVTVIDTRNDYEVAIGSFKGATDPNTKSFREFPAYAKANLDPQKNKRVAMFCTGGIRCEKSTAYLKEQGFEEVYHLQGGILKYLEEVPEEESLWQGECFVFDNRVSVDHSLEKGQYDQCHACRRPISQQDMRSEAYVKGVSCPHCIGSVSESQLQRFQEREKQVQLSKARGEEHIGTDAKQIIVRNKHRKALAKQSQRARIDSK